MSNIPTCPYCGCTTVQYFYSTSTAMGWSHIIKDGVDISTDPNYHTEYYCCCKCSHKFHIVRHRGQVFTVDDGAMRQVNESKPMPIINDSQDLNECTIESDKVNCSSTEVKIPMTVNIDKLSKDIEEIKQALAQLKTDIEKCVG